MNHPAKCALAKSTAVKSAPAKRVIPRLAALGSALGIAGFFSPLAQAAPGEDWQWVVAPYLWGSSISTDLQTKEPPLLDISNDTRFNDIVDDFDGIFQIHAEGQNDQYGVFADFTYLGLAGGTDRTLFHTDSDLDARLFELAAVWSPDEGSYQGLDVFGGLRYIDLDLNVQFVPANPAFDTATLDAGESFSDFMLGARYTWALNDRWGFTLRGDGSFGDTEGTWNASAMANYKMAYGALYFGYRYLSVELETDNSSTDIVLSGPVVGYGFAF